ncbi:hypothetical protein BDN70DRAFT_936849 [Pholiota conissans]|uniref:Uncharacterized protein n=1 Tax=Pholiota conissans TaxID=109636 RepID=A0A9P5YSA4_9AGAR|nr:hypothetical protein BDN70DRAFT_936849 [Pholiota conissans]
MSSSPANDIVQSKLSSIDISTYTSLMIYGLGSSDESPAEIKLFRSQSFPAPRAFEKNVSLPRDENWAPLSLPKLGAHL